ncbi:UvrD-helicase domain-containing protein [Candidatus Poriferisodalis sp.]|uniref:UvrD-helicase domain-containing protein n=1 Tax=Candidatus Poriferisodalis sp. TaxID=3101277 RepID=UPI003B525C43
MTVQSKATPADQAERDRATRSTGTTLFVEAGAGTGKTTALVGRVLELVTGAPTAPIRRVAAITFTDKAAAELRNRLRAGLNARLAAADDDESRRRLRDALDGLDGAAISTLHSFARRILAEHAIEAGLPPLFDTLDQIGSEVEFDERWRRFFGNLLADPEAHWAVAIIDAAGVGLTALRDIAVSFNANWDRVQIGDGMLESSPVRVDDLITQGRELSGRRSECHDAADPALSRFGQLDLFVERLSAAGTDTARIAVLLDADDPRTGVPKIGNVGRKANWDDIASVRESFTCLRECCTAAAAEALEAAIAVVCDRIARFTLEAAAQRRAAGRLEFHDQLVYARDLLRTSPSARAALHARYQHLLLDEFQDTDPIQIEIASLIAAIECSDPDGLPGSHGDASPPVAWDRIDTASGQLFFVGDPKQSIYRFRRADIGLYLAARQRYGSDTGSSATLNVNFRTTAPIIEWINATFSRLMSGDTTSGGTGLQPDYAPLDPWRPELGGGPAVVALGTQAHLSKRNGGSLDAEGIREVEAADVAGVINEIVGDGWQVEDRHTGRTRAARCSDIAVLIPTRTCLPQLEAGLGEASVPYRLEASEFVWRSRTVRDLMMCLRAVADPDDALAIVSALRTPVYGCGDDDLYVYRRSIPSWSCFTSDFSPLPGGDAHPVAQGLAHLRSLYDDHIQVSPAALLDRLVRERRVLEQAVAGPRTREAWRQVRYVIDQARAWSQSQHGGLRHFLRWASMQASERAKVTEAILPESDDDAVRVMTVHASKGLEFPIVIVAGLQGGNRPRSDSAAVGFESARDGSGTDSHWSGAVAVRLRAGVETAGYQEWADTEQLAGHHERIRLLYVACTRARDHLVVSLHRQEPSRDALTDGNDHKRTHAQLICDAMPEPASGIGAAAAVGTAPATAAEVALAAATATHRWDYRPGHSQDASPAAPAATGDFAPVRQLPERDEWLRRRDSAAAASSRTTVLSATRIARAGVEPALVTSDSREAAGRSLTATLGQTKELPDDHLGTGRAPGRRGRGATSVGKAVHGVLQSIDLFSGAGLSGLVAAQAVTEGVSASHGDIESFVQSALASDEVQRAASSRHWREVYTAAPNTGSEPGGVPATVVEGFIDLLYEDPATGGLVVVDYKTDALGEMPDIDTPRAEQYRRQGAVYAWCVERATGREVTQVVLLYLRQGEPARADRLEGDALRRAVDEVADLAGNLVRTPA